MWLEMTANSEVTFEKVDAGAARYVRHISPLMWTPWYSRGIVCIS